MPTSLVVKISKIDANNKEYPAPCKAFYMKACSENIHGHISPAVWKAECIDEGNSLSSLKFLRIFSQF
jgi:hypothetical protein